MIKRTDKDVKEELTTSAHAHSDYTWQFYKDASYSDDDDDDDDEYILRIC